MEQAGMRCVYTTTQPGSTGTGYKRINFTNLADAFRFYTIDSNGTQLAIMQFQGWRLWVNPATGKLHISNSDPATPASGTVVGTQT